jgi:hypothetical protein
MHGEKWDDDPLKHLQEVKCEVQINVIGLVTLPKAGLL